MDFKLIDIPAKLQPYVKLVWSLDTDFSEGDRGFASTYRQPLMPKEGSMIFLHRSSRPLFLNGQELRPVVFQGPNARAYELLSSGNINMVGIELKALTPAILFGRSFNELGLDPVTPYAIGDEQFIEIADRFNSCYSLTELVPLVFDFIQRKVDKYCFDNYKYRMVEKIIADIGDGTKPISLKNCCQLLSSSIKITS